MGEHQQAVGAFLRAHIGTGNYVLIRAIMAVPNAYTTVSIVVIRFIITVANPDLAGRFREYTVGIIIRNDIIGGTVVV